LALYEERQVHPSQITNATRLAMVWLSYWFDWGSALRVVTPETFTRWHRAGFRLFWRWKSKPGRPPLPTDFQMALENPTWGQERIANELLLQLGLRVSPRTVRKYIILHEWVAHYNEDRPHMALGPGIPQPSSALPVTPQAPRHQIPTGQRAVARSVLGGLHHD
jgi:hypothetical protein